MKRQISKPYMLWLSIVFALLFLLPLQAHGEAAEFAFDSKTGQITAYSGAGAEVVVPAELDGAAVRSLKYSVFSTNDSATVIVLPDTLEAIGSNNFFSCPSLTEVIVPARVAFIDSDCFSWCDSLKAVTFLGEAPVFASGSFSVLPEDFVCYVPDDQYDAYRAVIPSEIAMETTGVPAQAVNWTAPEADFDFDPLSGTITAYKGSATRVDVPESIGGTAVKTVGDSAFANHNGIYLINLPEGVEVIGREAFKYANDLVSVALPDTLRVIGEEAFNGGWHSRSIAWPAALEEIGPRAFRYTPLSGDLHFEGRTLTIGENAFEYTSVQSLYLTDTPVTIASHAFEGSRLNYLSINAYDLLEGIADDAFAGASYLADLDLPWDSAYENQLAWRAFMAEQAPNCYVWINNPTDCSLPASGTYVYEAYDDGTMYLASYSGDLEALVNYHTFDGAAITGIGDGVFMGNQTLKKFRATHSDKFTTIGAEAFADSAVEVVDLYYTVETIGDGAFRNCENLTEITLPASITHIGAGAFAGCTNLQSVNVLCDKKLLRAGMFVGCPMDVVELLGLTRMPFAANDESDFEFDAENGTITGYTGAGVDVVVPRAIGGVPVRAIGYQAFENCRDYRNTDVESNRTSWVHLRSVVLPETVTEISDRAFSYCQQLETFICYGPAVSTGKGTFTLCRNLKSVIFVNGVDKIDNYAFEGTDSFETFYSPIPLQYLGERAFVGSGLTGFVVNARSIGNSAFMNCEWLNELHFTDAAEEVDAAVVNNCPNLYLVCYETTDLSFIPDDGMIAGANRWLSIRVPEGTDEENLARAERSLIWGSDATADVSAQSCDRTPDEIPDIEGILAEYAENPYIAPDPAPAREPIEAVPVGEAGEIYLGGWILDSMVMGEDTYSAAELGMDQMAVVFHADGTAAFGDAGDYETVAWFVTESGVQLDAGEEKLELSLTEDSRLVMDEEGVLMIFIRAEATDEAPDHAEITEPVASPADNDEAPDLSDYIGVWHGVWMETGGMTGDPRTQYGLDIVLTLEAGGLGHLDYGGSDGGKRWGYDSESENIYYGLNEEDAMPRFLLDNGFLRYGTIYSGSIVFSQNDQAMWVPDHANESSTAADALPAPAEETQVFTGDIHFLETQFVCTSFSSAGVMMDAAMLGAEYSVILHEDGTLRFIMAGSDVPGLIWKADGDDFVVDYFGQGELRFVPNGDTLELDFFGGMQMTFRAE